MLWQEVFLILQIDPSCSERDPLYSGISISHVTCKVGLNLSVENSDVCCLYFGPLDCVLTQDEGLNLRAEGANQTPPGARQNAILESRIWGY